MKFICLVTLNHFTPGLRYLNVSNVLRAILSPSFSTTTKKFCRETDQIGLLKFSVKFFSVKSFDSSMNNGCFLVGSKYLARNLYSLVLVI